MALRVLPCPPGMFPWPSIDLTAGWDSWETEPPSIEMPTRHTGYGSALVLYILKALYKHDQVPCLCTDTKPY